MTDEQFPALVYGLLVLMLVTSGFIVNRANVGQVFKHAFAWVAIFIIFIVAFSFQSEGEAVWQRVMASVYPEKPRVDGEEVRIDRGIDGHFSVEARINGKPVVLLIDTGATTTSLSRDVAEAAGVEISDTGFGVLVETANGMTTMRRARARAITIGTITREDQPLWIGEDDGINVLGMSFLSSLGSWRVEGRTMVLVP